MEPQAVIWFARIVSIIILVLLAYLFVRGRPRYICVYPDGLRTTPMSYDRARRYARMSGGTVELAGRK